ncbi:C40 family peptidase [Actinomycetaceae bacterium L2_0104]
MTGRHAITREAALHAIDTPAGRGLIAAMAVGTAFGVAMPAANAAEQVSDKKAMGTLSIPEAETAAAASTEAVTAPEDAEWNIEQVALQDQNAVEVSASVAIPEPEPVVEEEVVEAEPVEATTTTTTDESSTYADTATTETTTATTQTYAAAAPVQEAAPAPSYSGSSSSIVNTAMSYVGSPYVWGGTSPSGWDCIGFVRYVYAQHGVNIGGSTTSVLSVGRQVPYSQAQAGDILYWPGHVAISLGNGQNVAAWNPGMGTTTGSDAWGGAGTPTVIRVFG